MNIRSTVVSAFFLAIGSLLTNFFTDAFSQRRPLHIVLWLAALAVLAVLSDWIARKYRPGPVLTALEIRQYPKQYLVVVLSTLNDKPAPPEYSAADAESPATVAAFLAKYAQFSGWNGWNPYAAIRPHLDSLRHLVLISTDGLNGSAHHRAAIHRRMAQLLPPTVQISHVVSEAGAISIVGALPQGTAGGVAADRADVLSKVYRECLADAKRKHIKDNNICFDITGGPRHLPMVAITEAVNQECTFSLVETARLASMDPSPVSMWNLKVPPSSS